MPVRLDSAELRRPVAVPLDARPAAVLALVTPGQPRDREADADTEAEIILIERVDRGGHHSGEISFPGGRVEAGDPDLEATAIREAEEEVALDVAAADVRIVGRLETSWIPVSGYRVTPILALAGQRPDLRPSPDEVASIVRAPLAAFLPGSPVEVVETTIRGFPLRFGAYRIGGHVVWGATARILGQLGVIAGGTPETRSPTR
jgi:8-oxo-dGTP pyrophosphatase MutT (NUDIX family)